LDNEIDVTAILYLLVQNRQQTHDRTLIGSGDNGLGIPRHVHYKSALVSNLSLKE